jgi:hypothetical protein
LPERKGKSVKLKIDPNTGMLPPVNELEVAEPGTSGETVRQQKLKAFAKARDEFHIAKQRYYEAYGAIKHMLITGAELQTGRLGVRSGVKYVRRRSYKSDLIAAKGESYQIRLLESTQPHAEFYWRLVRPKEQK